MVWNGTSPWVVLSCKTLQVRSADPPSSGNDTSQKVDPISVNARNTGGQDLKSHLKFVQSEEWWPMK